jgi:serine/threonine protein kinase
MGTVYRARDEKLERLVALKVLSPSVVTDDDSRRRFPKEALALAKLSHPHIAAVYDVGEQDSVDYLVMECVPGQTLSATLKAGRLSVERATSILLEIAGALEEAHEQGVIHRDLKPANVMIIPMIDFVGVVGPFKIPTFYLDRFEITNRDYQKFVDSGGYTKQEYWHEKFIRDGREIPWTEAVAAFRDTTNRPEPAGWIAGHYAAGQADLPVSGVSWFEASAYAFL